MLTDVVDRVDAGLQVGMQTSLFGSGAVSGGPLRAEPVALDARSSVQFEPGWLHGADGAFETLRSEMPWRAVERPMYDRIVRVPRLICTVDPSTLGPDHPLVAITRAVEWALDATFDSVGLNYYRHGGDSVAWHRDRIGSTGRPTLVALVSLGGPRTFALRRHVDHPSYARDPRATRSPRLEWRLGGGDLFVMRGASQREWEHAVPKERGVGPRISLAYRSRAGGGGPRNAARGVPPLGARHKLQ